MEFRVVIGYSLKLCAYGLEYLINSFEDFRVIKKVHIKDKLDNTLANFNDASILLLELKVIKKYYLTYIQELKLSFPNLKIILLSPVSCLSLGHQIISSGVDAYIHKSSDPHELLASLIAVTEGRTYFATEITQKFLQMRDSDRSEDVCLSKREKEVLTHLVRSKTNREIAKILELSENTVKTHRRNINEKFGVHNLIGLVRYACRMQLFDYDSDSVCKNCPFTDS